MHAAWQKKGIMIDGEMTDAVFPVIVSASRASDIPSFKYEWLTKSLANGHIIWKNPFSGAQQYVSFSECAMIVFWSKNPQSLIQFETRDFFHDQVDVIIHFTCNDYEREGYEANLPPLDDRIRTFRNLTRKYGKRSMLWRYDPFFVSDRINCDELCSRINRLAEKLAPLCSRLIFSFIEIEAYPHVKKRINRIDSSIRVPSAGEKLQIINTLSQISSDYSLVVSACALDEELSRDGIVSMGCIDYQNIKESFPDNSRLQYFLESFGSDSRNYRHKGQRKHCLCMLTKRNLRA